MSSHETSNIADNRPSEVSVLIPSYNHGNFVESCIRSILNQTRPPAQLIVIDDGSSDGSPVLIERALNNSPVPCELIVRKNRGLCATLNEGFKLSTGTYFAYLGSDDLWLPEFLEERVHLLESRPMAVLGYGHCYLIDGQDRIIDSTRDWAHYADGNARNMLLKTTAPMSPTVVYRRSFLPDEPWRQDCRLEDYDLYLRLAGKGDFAFDERVLSAWRQHDTNTSHNQWMMLVEQLAAQRRVAPELGLSEAELETLQTRTRFSRAEDFLRYGEKLIALRLMLQNWRGGSLSSNLIRMILRLGIPFTLMDRRKRAKSRTANERYGSIKAKLQQSKAENR
jgi:alpha-1,3-rhamnosyltransferase